MNAVQIIACIAQKHWPTLGGGGRGGGRLSKIKIVIKRTRIEDDENTCNLEAG